VSDPGINGETGLGDLMGVVDLIGVVGVTGRKSLASPMCACDIRREARFATAVPCPVVSAEDAMSANSRSCRESLNLSMADGGAIARS
jgi:hypothetical protein